jgi:hypothetical protein
MSAIEGRRSSAQLRRLQIILLLMLLWDLLNVFAALSFGSSLMKIDGTEIGGILGAKASFSGALLVPVAVYFYGLVRNPLRHPGVLWVGMVEQGSAILLSLYHVVGDDLQLEGAILTVVVSAILLGLLLVNSIRGENSG